MKKRLLAFVMTLVIIFTLIPSMPVYAAWGDDYNTSSTFYINNLSELQAFQTAVNSGKSFQGKTVILNNNINMGNINWGGIGTSSNYFMGTFNGNYNEITNYSLSGSNKGLFSYVKNATVVKLRVSKVTIVDNSTVISPLIAIAEGNTYVSDIVSSAYGKCIGYFGGIVARSGAVDKSSFITVKNSKFLRESETNKSVTRSVRTGGIVGSMYNGLIDNCYNEVVFSQFLQLSNRDHLIGNVGGIVGEVLNSAKIRNCEIFDDLYLTGGSRIGGIVGSIAGGSVENCKAVVSLTAYQYVGGIAGWASGSVQIINCISAVPYRSPYNSTEYVFYPGAVVGFPETTMTPNTTFYDRDVYGTPYGTRSVEQKARATFTIKSQIFTDELNYEASKNSSYKRWNYIPENYPSLGLSGTDFIDNSEEEATNLVIAAEEALTMATYNPA